MQIPFKTVVFCYENESWSLHRYSLDFIKWRIPDCSYKNGDHKDLQRWYSEVLHYIIHLNTIIHFVHFLSKLLRFVHKRKCFFPSTNLKIYNKEYRLSDKCCIAVLFVFLFHLSSQRNARRPYFEASKRYRRLCFSAINQSSSSEKKENVINSIRLFFMMS